MSKGTVEKYALLFVVCGIVFAANYAQYQVSGLAHLVVSDLHRDLGRAFQPSCLPCLFLPLYSACLSAFAPIDMA